MSEVIRWRFNANASHYALILNAKSIGEKNGDTWSKLSFLNMEIEEHDGPLDNSLASTVTVSAAYVRKKLWTWNGKRMREDPLSGRIPDLPRRSHQFVSGNTGRKCRGQFTIYIFSAGPRITYRTAKNPENLLTTKPTTTIRILLTDPRFLFLLKEESYEAVMSVRQKIPSFRGLPVLRIKESVQTVFDRAY